MGAMCSHNPQPKGRRSGRVGGAPGHLGPGSGTALFGASRPQHGGTPGGARAGRAETAAPATPRTLSTHGREGVRRPRSSGAPQFMRELRGESAGAPGARRRAPGGRPVRDEARRRQPGPPRVVCGHLLRGAAVPRAREGRPAPAEQRGRPKRRVPGGRPRRPERGPERGPERAPAPRPRASCTNFPGGGRGGRRGPAAPALPVLKLSLIFKGTRRM